MPSPAAIEASEPPPVLPPLRESPRRAAISWARVKSFSEALVFSRGGGRALDRHLEPGPAEDRNRLAQDLQDPVAVGGLPEADVQGRPSALGDDVGLLAAADEADVDGGLAGPQPPEPGDLGDELLDGADALLGGAAVGRPALDVEAHDEAALALELERPAGQGRLEAQDERRLAGVLADELGRRGVARLLGRVDEDRDPFLRLDVEAVKAA